MINHTNYPNGNIYLSGGMQKAKKLGAAWRILTSNVLKEIGYYPLDITALDRQYCDSHGELYHSFGSSGKHHLQMKSNIRKHFVHTDTKLIEHYADGVILYYDDSVRLGAGTISEAQVSYDLGLPVFIVNSYKTTNEVPGWLIALSTKIFDSFDELYVYLEDLPKGILKRDMYGNHNSNNEYLCSLCGDHFEKNKHHFVSKISPLYCGPCVDVVSSTFEDHHDRYEFFQDQIWNDLSLSITHEEK